MWGRQQGPILDEVTSAVGESATILKVNVDNNPQLAAQYGVRGIPTLLLFRNGSVVQQFVGVQSRDTLVDAISSLS